MGDDASAAQLLQLVTGLHACKARDKKQRLLQASALLDNASVRSAVSRGQPDDEVSWANVTWKLQAAFSAEVEENVKKALRFEEGNAKTQPKIQDEVMVLWNKLLDVAHQAGGSVQLECVLAASHSWLVSDTHSVPVPVLQHYATWCLPGLASCIRDAHSTRDMHDGQLGHTFIRLLRTCTSLLSDVPALAACPAVLQGLTACLAASVHCACRSLPNDRPLLLAALKCIDTIATNTSLTCEHRHTASTLCDAVSTLLTAYACDFRDLLCQELGSVVSLLLRRLIPQTIFHKSSADQLQLYTRLMTLYAPTGVLVSDPRVRFCFVTCTFDICVAGLKRFFQQLMLIKKLAVAEFHPTADELLFMAKLIVFCCAHKLPACQLNTTDIVSETHLRRDLQSLNDLDADKQAISWDFLFNLITAVAGHYNVTPWLFAVLKRKFADRMIQLCDAALQLQETTSDEKHAFSAHVALLLYKTAWPQVAQSALAVLGGGSAHLGPTDRTQLFAFCLRSVTVHSLKQPVCLLLARLLITSDQEMCDSHNERLSHVINQQLVTEHNMVDPPVCRLLLAYIARCDFAESDNSEQRWQWRKALIDWCLCLNLSAFARADAEGSTLLTALARGPDLHRVLPVLLQQLCFVRPLLSAVLSSPVKHQVDDQQQRLQQLWAGHDEQSIDATSTAEQDLRHAELIEDVLVHCAGQLRAAVEQAVQATPVGDDMTGAWRLYLCWLQCQQFHAKHSTSTLSLEPPEQCEKQLSDWLRHQVHRRPGAVTAATRCLAELHQLMCDGLCHRLPLPDALRSLAALPSAAAAAQPSRAKRPRHEAGGDSALEELRHAAVDVLMLSLVQSDETDVEEADQRYVIGHICRDRSRRDQLLCSLQQHGLSLNGRLAVWCCDVVLQCEPDARELLWLSRVLSGEQLCGQQQPLLDCIQPLAQLHTLQQQLALNQLIGALFEKVPASAHWLLRDDVTLLNIFVATLETIVANAAQHTRTLARLSLDCDDYMSLLEQYSGGTRSEADCMRVLYCAALVLQHNDCHTACAQHVLFIVLTHVCAFVHTIPHCAQMAQNIIRELGALLSVHADYLAAQIVTEPVALVDNQPLVKQPDRLNKTLQALLTPADHKLLGQCIAGCQLLLDGSAEQLNEPLSADWLAQITCTAFTLPCDDGSPAEEGVWHVRLKQLMRWLQQADREGRLHSGGRLPEPLALFALSKLYWRFTDQPPPGQSHWLPVESSDAVLKCLQAYSDGQLLDGNRSRASFLVHLAGELQGVMRLRQRPPRVVHCWSTFTRVLTDMIRCSEPVLLLPAFMLYASNLGQAVRLCHRSSPQLSQLVECTEQLLDTCVCRAQSQPGVLAALLAEVPSLLRAWLPCVTDAVVHNSVLSCVHALRQQLAVNTNQAVKTAGRHMFARLPVVPDDEPELQPLVTAIAECRQQHAQLPGFHSELVWVSELPVPDCLLLTPAHWTRLLQGCRLMNAVDASRLTQQHLDALVYRCVFVLRDSGSAVTEAVRTAVAEMLAVMLHIHQGRLPDQHAPDQALLSEMSERVTLQQHSVGQPWHTQLAALLRTALFDTPNNNLLVPFAVSMQNENFAVGYSDYAARQRVIRALELLTCNSKKKQMDQSSWLLAFHAANTPSYPGPHNTELVGRTLVQLLARCQTEQPSSALLCDEFTEQLLLRLIQINNDKNLTHILGAIQTVVGTVPGVGEQLLPGLLAHWAGSLGVNCVQQLTQLIEALSERGDGLLLCVFRALLLMRVNRAEQSPNGAVPSLVFCQLAAQLQRLNCHLSSVMCFEQVAAAISERAQPLSLFYEPADKESSRAPLSADDEQQLTECRTGIERSLLQVPALPAAKALTPATLASQYRMASLEQCGAWEELVKLYSGQGATAELRAALDECGVDTQLLGASTNYERLTLLGQWDLAHPLKHVNELNRPQCVFTLAKAAADDRSDLLNTHWQRMRTAQLQRLCASMRADTVAAADLTSQCRTINQLQALTHNLVEDADDVVDDDNEVRLVVCQVRGRQAMASAAEATTAALQDKQLNQAAFACATDWLRRGAKQKALNLMDSHVKWLKQATRGQNLLWESGELYGLRVQCAAGAYETAGRGLQQLIHNLTDKFNQLHPNRQISVAQSSLPTDDTLNIDDNDTSMDSSEQERLYLLCDAYMHLADCQQHSAVGGCQVRDPTILYRKAIEVVENNAVEMQSCAEQLALAHHALADYQFCEYRRLEEYMSSELHSSRVRRLRHCQDRQTDLLQLIQADANCRRDYKKYRDEVRQLEVEIEKVSSEYTSAAVGACEHYLKALGQSSTHDMDVFRVGRLWLNSNIQPIAHAVHESLQSGAISSHKWLPIWHQIVARLSDRSSPTMPSFKKAVDLVVNDTVGTHPLHTYYALVCVANSSHVVETDDDSVSRKQQADQLVRSFAAANPQCAQMLRLSQAYLGFHGRYEREWKSAGRRGQELHMSAKEPLLCRAAFGRIPLASQRVPVCVDGDYSQVPCVAQFSGTYERAIDGITAPVFVRATTTDGVIRKHIIKMQKEDDLRQDALMQQVFAVANQLFAASGFAGRMRTYHIQPLSSTGGVLEFCTGTCSMKEIIEQAHERFSPNGKRAVMQARHTFRQPNVNEAGKHMALKASVEEMSAVFVGVCQQLAPCFGRQFYAMYPLAHEWFARRNTYVTSVAVASIVGHILGIGDRHLTNILFDRATAELVHIDFGIGFENGRKLPVPELVPFRLTRELVAPMGVTGTQGLFRDQCCTTLQLLTQHTAADILTGLLSVLLYDPLSNWALTEARKERAQLRYLAATPVPRGNTPDAKQRKHLAAVAGASQLANTQQQRLSTATQQPQPPPESHSVFAQQTMCRLQEKLQGREAPHMKPMRTQQHVNYVITEATRLTNLAMIFDGWQPYL